MAQQLTTTTTMRTTTTTTTLSIAGIEKWILMCRFSAAAARSSFLLLSIVFVADLDSQKIIEFAVLGRVFFNLSGQAYKAYKALEDL